MHTPSSPALTSSSLLGGKSVTLQVEPATEIIFSLYGTTSRKDVQEIIGMPNISGAELKTALTKEIEKRCKSRHPADFDHLKSILQLYCALKTMYPKAPLSNAVEEFIKTSLHNLTQDNLDDGDVRHVKGIFAAIDNINIRIISQIKMLTKALVSNIAEDPSQSAMLGITENLNDAEKQKQLATFEARLEQFDQKAFDILREAGASSIEIDKLITLLELNKSLTQLMQFDLPNEHIQVKEAQRVRIFVHNISPENILQAFNLEPNFQGSMEAEKKDETRNYCTIIHKGHNVSIKTFLSKDPLLLIDETRKKIKETTKQLKKKPDDAKLIASQQQLYLELIKNQCLAILICIGGKRTVADLAKIIEYFQSNKKSVITLAESVINIDPNGTFQEISSINYKSTKGVQSSYPYRTSGIDAEGRLKITPNPIYKPPTQLQRIQVEAVPLKVSTYLIESTSNELDDSGEFIAQDTHYENVGDTANLGLSDEGSARTPASSARSSVASFSEVENLNPQKINLSRVLSGKNFSVKKTWNAEVGKVVKIDLPKYGEYYFRILNVKRELVELERIFLEKEYTQERLGYTPEQIERDETVTDISQLYSNTLTLKKQGETEIGRIIKIVSKDTNKTDYFMVISFDEENITLQRLPLTHLSEEIMTRDMQQLNWSDIDPTKLDPSEILKRGKFVAKKMWNFHIGDVVKLALDSHGEHYFEVVSFGDNGAELHLIQLKASKDGSHEENLAERLRQEGRFALFDNCSSLPERQMMLDKGVAGVKRVVEDRENTCFYMNECPDLLTATYRPSQFTALRDLMLCCHEVGLEFPLITQSHCLLVSSDHEEKDVVIPDTFGYVDYWLAGDEESLKKLRDNIAEVSKLSDEESKLYNNDQLDENERRALLRDFNIKRFITIVIQSAFAEVPPTVQDNDMLLNKWKRSQIQETQTLFSDDCFNGYRELINNAIKDFKEKFNLHSSRPSDSPSSSAVRFTYQGETPASPLVPYSSAEAPPQDGAATEFPSPPKQKPRKGKEIARAQEYASDKTPHMTSQRARQHTFKIVAEIIQEYFDKKEQSSESWEEVEAMLVSTYKISDPIILQKAKIFFNKLMEASTTTNSASSDGAARA